MKLETIKSATTEVMVEGHCADRYVCDCEGWVPPVADEGKA